MFLYICSVCFVLLRFRPYAFVEAAALRSIDLRYERAPIATRVFLLLLLFLRCRFFRVFFLYHFRFIFVWRVRRTFFPSFRMVFFYVLPCDHGRNFFKSNYVRIQSINQSHGESTINRADHPISYYPDKLIVVVVVVVVSHIQRTKKLLYTVANPAHIKTGS